MLLQRMTLTLGGLAGHRVVLEGRQQVNEPVSVEDTIFPVHLWGPGIGELKS